MDTGLIVWPRSCTSPMTLILGFQGQILNWPYLKNGTGADWHGRKRMRVDMLDPLYDLDLWPWLRIFKFKFWGKKSVPGWPWKTIGHSLFYVPRSFVHRFIAICELTPVLSFGLKFWLHPWPWSWIFKVIFWKSGITNGWVNWHGAKGNWADRMCVLNHWTWIFKGKFWNSRIPGTGWLIHIERKGVSR